MILLNKCDVCMHSSSTITIEPPDMDPGVLYGVPCGNTVQRLETVVQVVASAVAST